MPNSSDANMNPQNKLDQKLPFWQDTVMSLFAIRQDQHTRFAAISTHQTSTATHSRHGLLLACDVDTAYVAPVHHPILLCLGVPLQLLGALICNTLIRLDLLQEYAWRWLCYPFLDTDFSLDVGLLHCNYKRCRCGHWRSIAHCVTGR